jgi:pyrroloquinoline quinone biosynthesis protein B
MDPPVPREAANMKSWIRPTIVAALVLVVLAGATFWATRENPDSPRIVVLGIAQDGGHPHIGCAEECCAQISAERGGHYVASLALVDPESGRRWIFDATPDFPAQLRLLDRIAPVIADPQARQAGIDGIFLTHAHIGHYTGLMYLGREAMAAQSIPVYAMPRMAEFLAGNGPWDQLVALDNIRVVDLEADRVVELGGKLTVTPWVVPHRDEYSETVGFLIAAAHARVLYIPDIDKWDRWDRQLEEVLEDVDHAFLDATFYSRAELPGRSLEEIPHPVVQETLARLADLPERQRRKVIFIHLNHTNPALVDDGPARQAIEDANMRVAEQGEVLLLN